MSNTNCHTEDRNFCGPDGLDAALFIDVDGTMLECQPYFDQASADFAYFLGRRGFDPAEARKLLAEIDHAKTEEEGFERDRFGNSMVDTYLKLVATKRRRFKPEDIEADKRILLALGQSPYFRTPKLFENCAAVLGRAVHNFRMFAVTIGNREAQKYKVRQAGLEPIFDGLIVTAHDNKPEYVLAAMQDMGIDPKLSAFIGNSLRSDGANLQHTNYIHLPLETGWSFDQSRALPENTGFQVFYAKNWREAEEKGINRLIRMRHAQAQRKGGAKGKTGRCAPCDDIRS